MVKVMLLLLQIYAKALNIVTIMKTKIFVSIPLVNAIAFGCSLSILIVRDQYTLAVMFLLSTPLPLYHTGLAKLTVKNKY